MTTRVAIDLNVRVRGNQTYAGFEDVDGGLAPGDSVEVYERESGLAGPAQVTDVDNTRQLVYLAVEWSKLREPGGLQTPKPDLGGRPILVIVDGIVLVIQQIAEAIEKYMAGVRERLRSGPSPLPRERLRPRPGRRERLRSGSHPTRRP